MLSEIVVTIWNAYIQECSETMVAYVATGIQSPGMHKKNISCAETQAISRQI